MGKDGISSWLFGAESSTVPWGPSPSAYRFDHVTHLVRDPLSAIPSIATFKRSAWDYISRHISVDASDSLLVKSAKYWLYWNGMIERKADLRLRIEEMPGALKSLGDRIGEPLAIPAMDEIPRDLNTRRYGRLFSSLETRCLRFGLVRHSKTIQALLSKLPSSYDDITWADLKVLDHDLAKEVYEKALEYGYLYPTRSF